MVAYNRSENGIKEEEDEAGGDLDGYELWREMKTQVKLLREDMDTADVKYHAQEPTDLLLRAPAGAHSERSLAPAGPSSALSFLSGPPSGLGGGRVERNLNSPHLTTDCDFRYAPLINDEGRFTDSRYDGIASRVLL